MVRFFIVKATSFQSLELKPELLKNVASLGYSKTTPIQAQSLPPILEGKDVIGQAKTGSGKTAAFGLRILQRLDVSNLQTQALVLCPTRELADQVAKALRQLARMSHNVKVLPLCGGMPYRPQVSSLQHGTHIVVGTPGRINKHLRTGNLKLDALRVLVLDEGDRMLEMGFQEEVDAIIEKTPAKRQTLLFSATYPRAIQSIAEKVMINPVTVKVESSHDSSSIRQRFYKCGASDEDRMTALRLLLLKYKPTSAIVFCGMKTETQQVRDELEHFGFSAAALHGDLDQIERDETLIRFSNKSVSILVATDVAARGLDIDSVNTVINYRISKDAEVHVHRIGRTGRAGSKGMACTLFNAKDRDVMERLKRHFGKSLEEEPLPSRTVLNTRIEPAAMVTLCLRIGKKQKARPGNILGALTGDQGLRGEQVGQILVTDGLTYVAVAREAAKHALKILATETWKGRPFKSWQMKEFSRPKW